MYLKGCASMEAKPERLQKILAAAGLASRRKAEELIAAGVVSVNGHVITEPGTKADPRVDEIRVDGKLLRGPERHVYLAIYKPKGYMTTVSDPEGRPTVMDLLKGVDERVFPVGRLDYMSEGLLLLTNDGELMAQLTRAGSHVAKTYMVKVSGKPTDENIDKLRNGIMLPPEPGLTGARGKKQPGTERRSFAVLTQPADIQLAVDQENPWFEVTLMEGRNRQIRRMFEQIGHHIEKIKRIRYGSLTLDLEPGEFRHLTPKEVNQLRKSLETPFKPKPVKLKQKPAHKRQERISRQRAERQPRLDAARFVQGRRGKQSAEAPGDASFTRRRPDAAPTRGSFGSERGSERRPFAPRDDRQKRSAPRGPEFDREARSSNFAGKRGDYKKRDRSFDNREGGFERREGGYKQREGGYKQREDRNGGYKKREGGFEKRQERFPRRENDFAAEKRTASGGAFSRFERPKFSKPPKHREFEDRESFASERERKRPYSGERGPSKGRGFSPKPAGERKFSKGPGKPGGSAQRSGEFNQAGKEFKPGRGGDFKRPGGGFKSGGGFKRSAGEFSPGGSKRRPTSRPPSPSGRPSRPPRRRDEE